MTKRTKQPDLKMDESRRLWKAVLRDYPLDESGIEVLRTAVMSYDNFLRFQEMLMKTGPVYTNKGMVKRNPIIDMLRIERSGFLQAMNQLGLESDDEPKRGPGRPLKRFG
jgi:phage terminase small subunit